MNIGYDIEKRCSKCGEYKAVDNFYKDKSHKDGLSSRCKKCANNGHDPIPYNMMKVEVPIGYKYCKKCGESKPIDSFYNQKSSKDGKMLWCKQCSDKSARDWASNNQVYQEKHRKYGMEYFQKNKANIIFKRKEQYMTLKVKALSHYSGGGIPHCVRCGIDDIDVLCLDHINGGGTKERRGTPRKDIHRILHCKNYPEGYQTLCANCNLKKEMELRRNND